MATASTGRGAVPPACSWPCPPPGAACRGSAMPGRTSSRTDWSQRPCRGAPRGSRPSFCPPPARPNKRVVHCLSSGFPAAPPHTRCGLLGGSQAGTSRGAGAGAREAGQPLPHCAFSPRRAAGVSRRGSGPLPGGRLRPCSLGVSPGGDLARLRPQEAPAAALPAEILCFGLLKTSETFLLR